MKHEYFVDTSYFLALELKQDQNHQIAQSHWQDLLIQTPSLVITSYVFDEIVTYLNSRGHHQKAVELGTLLYSKSAVTFIQVDEGLLDMGWIYFQRYSDKRYSLTDCISFVVMAQRNISTALTFDHHFVQAGFLIEPKKP